MTLDQFRRHPTFPSRWAQELESNEILRIVLQVMEENHPARYTVLPDKNNDLSPTRAAFELGDTRGYSKYGDRLKMLAIRQVTAEDIGPPTYEKEPVEVKQNG